MKKQEADDVEDNDESEAKDGQLNCAIVSVTEQESKLIGSIVDVTEQSTILRHKIKGFGAATFG